MSDARPTPAPPPTASGPVVLSDPERAAARAFLQRCEVRLSTLHRVATALLSGAGLVVLLPAIARDALTSVISELVVLGDPARLILLVGFTAVLGFPLLALWMLLRELTRFYFHSHHLSAESGSAESGSAESGSGESGAVFTPRFTLTGLRIPADELSADAHRALAQIRADREHLDLVVPPTAAGRADVDRRLRGYGLPAGDDHRRAEGLHLLVASVDRDLLTEVAKMEAGMVRHLLRLQVVVLRYVKALAVFVVTVIAVFAGAAVVERSADPAPAGGVDPTVVGLGLIVLVWVPVIGAVVASPVRWVEQMLRAEGARSAAVAADRELTRMEHLGIWLSSGGWIAAAVALAITLGDTPAEGVAARDVAVLVAVVIISVLTAAAQAAVVRRWLVRRRRDS